MTKNKLTSDAYYSMIREGLNCIVEDKSVKTHEQAFQLAKNDIEKFAKAAHAHSFIKRLPQGYDQRLLTFRLISKTF